MAALSLYQRCLQRLLMRMRPNILAAWLKPLLGVKRLSVKTKQGEFWVDPVSLLGVALTRRGHHEEAMIQTLYHHLKPGGCFVDLGANEGYFTVIAARLCGAEGRVISIEPQNRLLPVIRENLRLNQSNGVTLVNAAVGDSPGAAIMSLTASTNTGGSGFGRMSRFRLPTQEVNMMTLEQLMDQHQLAQVDLMKVDIEGFEYEALLGSPKVFEQRRIRAMALELHPGLLKARGKNAADIEAMLKRCGYQRHQDAENVVWVAPCA